MNELVIAIILLIIAVLWIYTQFSSINFKNDENKKEILKNKAQTEEKIQRLQEQIKSLENKQIRLDTLAYNNKLNINTVIENNEKLLSNLRIFASSVNDRFRTIQENIDSKPRTITSCPEKIILGEEQKKILDFIQNNNDNILIMGAAGTGKSTLAKQIRETVRNICVVSPTGIAALNIQGSTIHSLFKLPPKDFLNKKQFSKISIIENINTLLIDEISMVRPDVLDVIDTICKKSKKDSSPFGGIRIIAIGDLCQLPPIIKKCVAPIFKKKYKYETAYFFDAPSYKKGKFKKFTLTKTYRQQDDDLLTHLNNIRVKKESAKAIDFFNKCSVTSENEIPNATIISPYKKIVETYNNSKLNELNTKEMTYSAVVSGIIEEDPAPRTLRLKENALVMFTCNNHPLWVNGTTGIIEELTENNISIKLFDGRNITIQRYTWKNYEYLKNGKTVTQKEIGSFSQFPLQIGYAITVHKSQGKTLDSIIFDKGRGMFAPGQLYVALSRIRKTEDLHILRPIKEKDIIIDSRVIKFMNKI